MEQKAKAKWRIIGSICVMISALFTGVNEVIIKLSKLTVLQFVFGRFVIQAVLAVLWWTIQKPTSPHLFKSFTDDQKSIKNTSNTKVNNWYGDKPYIFNIWLRGILFAIAEPLYYVSLILVPIGDDQCILYQSPLLAIYIAAFAINEALPSWYILIPSTFMTIWGIVLISQPTFLLQLFDSSNKYEPLNVWGVLTASLSAICWVFVVLLVRKAKDSHFLQLEFASSICLMFIVLPITGIINTYFFKAKFIGGFDLFDETQWLFDIDSILIMTALGFFGFGQLSFSVVGYQIGSATYVSWLEYITIPIGFIYQWKFFNDAPNRYEMIGALLVTTGCLLPLIKQLYIYCTSKRNTSYMLANTVELNDL